MFPNLQLSFNKFQLSSAETPREENSWSQICRDRRGYLAVFRVDVLLNDRKKRKKHLNVFSVSCMRSIYAFSRDQDSTYTSRGELFVTVKLYPEN